VNSSREVVLDASVLVDVLVGSDLADRARTRLRGTTLHVPAHFDAEVLAALGRLHRAGALTVTQVTTALKHLAQLPLTRHLLNGLVNGAWERRTDLRLVDALYVELAETLDLPLLTTDLRLTRACPRAEAIE